MRREIAAVKVKNPRFPRTITTVVSLASDCFAEDKGQKPEQALWTHVMKTIRLNLLDLSGEPGALRV